MQLDMTPSGASPSFSPSPTAFGPSLITFTLHHPSPLLLKFKGVRALLWVGIEDDTIYEHKYP